MNCDEAVEVAMKKIREAADINKIYQIKEIQEILEELYYEGYNNGMGAIPPGFGC